jgi:hypothetical protein
VFDRAVQIDFDTLVEHPLGGRFVFVARPSLDVVERSSSMTVL